MILNQIGQGGYSDVFVAKNKKTGEKVAAKVIKKSFTESGEDYNMVERLVSETRLMQEVEHKNVSKVIEPFSQGKLEDCEGTTSQEVFAVFELAQSLDFFDLLFRSGSFSEPTARFYFK